MKVDKSTHEPYHIELFMPIMKECEGKYVAVLSDDSTDRDDERVSRSCIEDFGRDDYYLAALLNHDNDILNLVAEWVNKRVVEIDGNIAFIAEPKFYESNPKAKIIKGMLDEGAKPGISIGAMVIDYDEINGQRVYTKLELVEASFVGIPSNRHGRAMAVAKNFNNINIKLEDRKMDKQFTQKDIDKALEKKADDLNVEFTKQMDEKKSEIENLKKDLKTQKEEKEVVDTKLVSTEKSLKESTEKSVTLEKDLEKAKDVAIEKQNFANQGEEDPKDAPEDVDKSFESGKIPIMRGM